MFVTILTKLAISLVPVALEHLAKQTENTLDDVLVDAVNETILPAEKVVARKEKRNRKRRRVSDR